MKRLRASISADERTEIDAAICERVCGLPAYREAELVLTYLSFGTEVGTWPLIRRAWADGKRVAIPRCEPGPRVMRWYVVDSFDDLVPSPHGMREPDPERSDEVVPTDLRRALAVVPAFTFDPAGLRLGYGGGYYDTFLAFFAGVSVGLCRECQMEDDLAALGLIDAHDRAVDYVVTEDRVITCEWDRSPCPMCPAKVGRKSLPRVSRWDRSPCPMCPAKVGQKSLPEVSHCRRKGESCE